MSGLVVELQSGLYPVASTGHQGAERVISLVGIERPEFFAEDRLVVCDECRATDSVVYKVQLPTEIRVPHKTWIRRREVFGRKMKSVPRQELYGSFVILLDRTNTLRRDGSESRKQQQYRQSQTKGQSQANSSHGPLVCPYMWRDAIANVKDGPTSCVEEAVTSQ